jgi:hypothetical protein
MEFDVGSLGNHLHEVLQPNDTDMDASAMLQYEHSDDVRKDEQSRINKRLEEIRRHEEGVKLRMPRWRFLEQGRVPRPEDVLRGKSLFKAYALGVRGMIATPAVRIRRRRLATSAHEKKEDEKALGLLVEQSIAWVSKNVRIPLQSIQQDASLDFEASIRRSTPVQNQLTIPLRVRVRSVVRGLCSEVPSLSLSRLLKLVVSDGHYLPAAYFSDYELTLLEFDKYGATTNMIPRASRVSEPDNVMRINNRNGDISRCRTLLLTHFVLKVLAYHLVLTPWAWGICTVPQRQHMRRTMSNLFHVASLLHIAARKVIPGLAEITRKADAAARTDALTPGIQKEDRGWFMSLLEALVPSDQFEDLEVKYGMFFDKSRPLYDSHSRILEHFSAEHTYIEAGLEPLIDECAAMLQHWIQKCLIGVVNVEARVAEAERRMKEKSQQGSILRDKGHQNRMQSTRQRGLPSNTRSDTEHDSPNLVNAWYRRASAALLSKTQISVHPSL